MRGFTVCLNDETSGLKGIHRVAELVRGGYLAQRMEASGF